MKRSRISEEQIIRVLKEREAGMPSGKLRNGGVTSDTYASFPILRANQSPQSRKRRSQRRAASESARSRAFVAAGPASIATSSIDRFVPRR